MNAAPITLAVLGQTPVKSTAMRWARNARKAGHQLVIVTRGDGAWIVYCQEVR